MYEQGQGVPQDAAEAARWYRKAAQQGHAEAQKILGDMYANGHGVARDAAEAARWYRKAAQQGYAEARKKLGLIWQIQQMIGWQFFLVLAGIAGAALLAWRRWKSSARGEEDGRDQAACGTARRSTVTPTPKS
jgi:TPR repeat protein